MFDTFNNRDWSLLIWSTIIIGFFIWAGRARIGSLFKAALQRYIVTIFLLVIGYVYCSIKLLSGLGIWDVTMTKDAVLWTVGVALPMIKNAIKASEGKYKLKEALIDNLKLTVLIEFIVNLYVFELWLELLIVPFMTIITIMMAYSERKPEYAVTYKLLNRVTGIVGIFMLYHAIKYLVLDFKGFATIANLDNFLFPIFMTVLYLPFMYFLAIYVAYEQFFLRVDNAFRHHKPMIPFVKWSIFKKGSLNLRIVRTLSTNLHIYELTEKKEFTNAINRFK
jgi:hypothetical protein